MSATHSLQAWTRTTRRRLKTIVGARPGLFFLLYRLRPAFNGLLVTKDTDICIEGFPRSANSFAVGAFRCAQSRPVQIAHHTHVPANGMRACEWEIPTVVLIRSPYDAIVSRIALEKEGQIVEQGMRVPHQRVSFATWLHAWESFYQTLEPYRDQGRLVVAPFSVVIQDLGQIIEHVNARFGTGFEPFDHTDEAVATIHTEQGYHAGPNDRRMQLKEETRTDFDRALRTNATLRTRMDAAEQLFATYADEAVAGVSTA